MLLDNNISREENINLYLSFFARLSHLERLCLSMKTRDNDYTKEFLDELSWHLSPVLPSLRSLRCHFPTLPDLLFRLMHISKWSIPSNPFLSAQSLCSWFLSSLIYKDLQAAVEAMPQYLERLSLEISFRLGPGTETRLSNI